MFILTLYTVQAAGPSNGDLRLVNSTGGPSSLEGSLQIYLTNNGSWGAVCVRTGSNTGLYDTVCQQLGYTGAAGTGSHINVHNGTK